VRASFNAANVDARTIVNRFMSNTKPSLIRGNIVSVGLNIARIFRAARSTRAAVISSFPYAPPSGFSPSAPSRTARAPPCHSHRAIPHIRAGIAFSRRSHHSAPFPLFRTFSMHYQRYGKAHRKCIGTDVIGLIRCIH
jgi:hypothetical protein